MIKENILNLTSPAQPQAEALKSDYGLEKRGLRDLNNTCWNLPTEALYEEIVFRSEGKLTKYGSVAVPTGDHTFLAVDDKFIVREPDNEKPVWWGEYNRPFSVEKFNTVYQRLLGYMQGRDLFVRDSYGGVDERYQFPVRVITEYAWHSLMTRNLLVRPKLRETYKSFVPEFTIISVPTFKAQPEIDGTLSSTFILLNLDQRLCLIGGSGYGGEIKKSLFTILNLLMTRDRTLTMRCSANTGEAGTALFFGETGVGKTSLATDSERKLIGDDMHAWCSEGIFNLEAGCYAKTICLSKDDEPEIHAMTRKYGTVLENVGFDPVSRRLDLDDSSATVNTRATYPLNQVRNAVTEPMSNAPKHIFLLTCDATGVLPPIAKLSHEQAVYHFVSGYTNRVDSPIINPAIKPPTIFSACYGAQFMVHHPDKYAKLFQSKISRHNVNCWLVNTGWTAGNFGTGHRIDIKHTRALLKAAIIGELDNVPYETDPIFSFEIPQSCKGLPENLLNPESTWEDSTAYREQRISLACLFIENFKKFSDRVAPEISLAGPQKENFQQASK